MHQLVVMHRDKEEKQIFLFLFQEKGGVSAWLRSRLNLSVDLQMLLTAHYLTLDSGGGDKSVKHLQQVSS